MNAAVNLFTNDAVGGLVQVAIQGIPELQIFRPKRMVHEGLGSPDDHGGEALALIAIRLQTVAAAKRPKQPPLPEIGQLELVFG